MKKKKRKRGELFDEGLDVISEESEESEKEQAKKKKMKKMKKAKVGGLNNYMYWKPPEKTEKKKVEARISKMDG